MSVFFLGCSNEGIYDVLQKNTYDDCIQNAINIAEEEKCKQQASMSYEQYDEKRKAP